MKKRTRAPARTLTRLRADAPPEDRREPALARTPAPQCAERYARFARTLPELRQRCEKHGEAAALNARYEAAERWTMDWPAPGLPHPREVASESLRLCREDAMYASGLHHPNGGPFPLPIIRRISPGSREEARRVAADTMRAWDAAGGPHMTPARITFTHQYIIACMKAKEQESRA